MKKTKSPFDFKFVTKNGETFVKVKTNPEGDIILDKMSKRFGIDPQQYLERLVKTALAMVVQKGEKDASRTERRKRRKLTHDIRKH